MVFCAYMGVPTLAIGYEVKIPRYRPWITASNMLY